MFEICWKKNFFQKMTAIDSAFLTPPWLTHYISHLCLLFVSFMTSLKTVNLQFGMIFNFIWWRRNHADKVKKITRLLSAHLPSQWESVQFTKFGAKELLNCRFVGEMVSYCVDIPCISIYIVVHSSSIYLRLKLYKP